MANQNHIPGGQPGGGQFTSGDDSGNRRTTNTVTERVAMRQMTDARRYLAARVSIRNIKPPVMYASTMKPGKRGERVDMPHHRGVDAATVGKKL